VVFGKLFGALRKTRDALARGFARLLHGRQLDEALLEELEVVLYGADLGNTATAVVGELKEAWKRKEVRDVQDVPGFLRRALLRRLDGCAGTLARAPSGPTVILVVGVNGSGKTTSIAKLAAHLARNHTVLLGAGDTFRAAAVEQLTLWAQRIGVGIVKQPTGADPAAVAYDAVAAAIARRVDYLILDTAGRLHTQKNLMEELKKIVRVIQKQIPAAPHETLLILDATTGQNAIRQAGEFTAAAKVTGLLLAKMDGTAKGGAVFGIREQLPIPVKFLGVGERVEDLEPFVPDQFVDAILALEPEPDAERQAR
jgi:fused signal recognition particle receptor